MLIRQIVADGETPLEAEIDCVADFSAIPWLQSWREQPKFAQFSLRRGAPGVPDCFRLPTGPMVLMAEFDDGYQWFAVAHVFGDMDGIPDWEARYRRSGLQYPRKYVTKTPSDSAG